MGAGPLEPVLVLLLTAVLSMARVFAAISLFPLFASDVVPMTARIVVALAFSLLMLPGVQAHFTADPALLMSADLFWMLLKEIFVGAVLGFSFGLLFWALENVGHLIDFQSGLTFTQVADPVLGNQSSVHARLVGRLFAIYFLAVGGLQLFLHAIYASFALWPLMSLGIEIKPLWLSLFVDQTSLLFSLSLLFAAPVVMVLLLVELGFGLFNRAAPNFNIFDVTRPLKGWLASLILLLCLPFILERSWQVIGRYRHLLDLLHQVM